MASDWCQFQTAENEILLITIPQICVISLRALEKHLIEFRDLFPRYESYGSISKPFQLVTGVCLSAEALASKNYHHGGPPPLPAYTPAPHIASYGHSPVPPHYAPVTPAPYPPYGYSPSPYAPHSVHHPYTPAVAPIAPHRTPKQYHSKKPVEGDYGPPKCAMNTTKTWYVKQ